MNHQEQRAYALTIQGRDRLRAWNMALMVVDGRISKADARKRAVQRGFADEFAEELERARRAKGRA